MNRLERVLAPLTVLMFLTLTSSDLSALLFVVLHLPPNWAPTALVVLGGFLLVRWALRRRGHDLRRIAALLAVELLRRQIASCCPLWTWFRFGPAGRWQCRSFTPAG